MNKIDTLNFINNDTEAVICYKEGKEYYKIVDDNWKLIVIKE
ncbi:hypothetical protein [Clostridium algoriphilum]|nr:hypothetical protein [Clostridium algoriphilum]